MSTKQILKEQLVQFATAKGVQFTEERISINAEMLVRKFHPSLCVSALEDLFFETDRFPDASIIAKKINEKLDIGVNTRTEATKKASDIIAIIHDCGFDPVKIKSTVGDQVYRAIGGSSMISEYGSSSHSDATTYKAQIRDAVSNIASSCKKADDVNKLREVNNNPGLTIGNTLSLHKISQ